MPVQNNIYLETKYMYLNGITLNVMHICQ